MASTYTTRLRIEKIGLNEQNGTWGTSLNTAFEQCIEEAIAGIAAVSMSDANYTLTTANGTTDEARRAIIHLTGALTASRNVVCPAVQKIYMVYNATSGGQSIVFKTSGGTGVTVPNGKRMLVYCDATNVLEFFNYTNALSDYVPLSGGTLTGQLILPTAGPTSPYAAGFRGYLPITVSGDKTLALSDAQSVQFYNGASTVTVTIPANASVAYPVGTRILVVLGNGGGQVSFAITSDTLIGGAALATAGSSALLVKTDTTTWVASS